MDARGRTSRPSVDFSALLGSVELLPRGIHISRGFTKPIIEPAFNSVRSF